MEELTNEIDRYLSEEMSPSELETFKKRLESDESLRGEVNLQRKTFRLLEAAAWVETKNKVARLNKKSSKTITMVTLSKIAAVLVIGLITSYIIVHRSYSDQNLYASYHQPYPDRLTTMGNSTRLSLVMASYNKQHYALAQKQFSVLRNDEVGDEKLLVLYEAVCFNELKNYSQTIQLLETYKSTNSSTSAIDWELILSYVAVGNDTKAKKLLKDFLKNDEGYKISEAKELLDNLNSFWR